MNVAPINHTGEMAPMIQQVPRVEIAVSPGMGHGRHRRGRKLLYQRQQGIDFILAKARRIRSQPLLEFGRPLFHIGALDLVSWGPAQGFGIDCDAESGTPSACWPETPRCPILFPMAPASRGQAQGTGSQSEWRPLTS